MKTCFSALFLVCLLAGAGCRHLPSENAATRAPQPPSAEPFEFVVSFPETVRTNPASGRVLLLLSLSGDREPRFNTTWFDLEPVFAIPVTNLAPGETVRFRPDDFDAPEALAFPEPLNRLPPGTYYAQALLDLDHNERDFARGTGNLYSKPVRFVHGRNPSGQQTLIMDQVIASEPPEDTDWIKFVEIRSERLSAFHGRDVFMRCAVILPSTYSSEPERQYPALYVIPGFGGRHTNARRWIDGSDGERWRAGDWPLQIVQVILDPDVPFGHSVFANSDNNGPVGDALVQELIPEVERRFRVLRQSRARFLTGHSSGGWSSLWLQITYPDFFGGTWSTAPDPVDFRAFQTINIYEDRNGHWTPDGLPRPVARTRYETSLAMSKMNHWEYVIGYGGQLDSFDAVFSPRGEDGRPRPLIDKLTGVIDRDTAEAWKRYDIRLILEQQWPELGPRLFGKLHLIGGAWDTFYLEPALEMLKAFLDTKNHGGYVEILPGDHGSFMTQTLRTRIHTEIAQKWNNNERNSND